MTDPASQFRDVIERFDHVSMAVSDLSSMAELVSVMGGIPLEQGHATAGDFDWAQYELPGNGRLELISTSSPDPSHFITQFIENRGEGLHHLTFKVTNIEHAYQRAQALGFDVVGYNTTDPAWRELFIHPKSAHGVLIQFAEFEDTKGT